MECEDSHTKKWHSLFNLGENLSPRVPRGRRIVEICDLALLSIELWNGRQGSYVQPRVLNCGIGKGDATVYRLMSDSIGWYLLQSVLEQNSDT